MNSALNITIIILIFFFSIYHALQSCTCDIVMPHLVGVLVTTSFYSKERQHLKTPLLLDLSQHGLARDRCWSCPPPRTLCPILFPTYLFIYQHVLMCVIVVTLIAFHLPPYRLAQPRGSVVVSGDRSNGSKFSMLKLATEQVTIMASSPVLSRTVMGPYPKCFS